MTHRNGFFFSWIVLATLVAACGDKEPATLTSLTQRQAAPDDLGRLVPADAVAYIQLAPLGVLQVKVRQLLAVDADQRGRAPDVTDLYSAAGIPRDDIDRSLPSGVALSMTEAGPVPTFIVPVKDAAVAAELAKNESRIASGRYVATCRAGTPVAGSDAPGIARDLPGGDIALRVKVRELVPVMAPVLERALQSDELKKQNPAGAKMLELMGKGFLEALRAMENYEGGVVFDGGRADARVRITFEEGSGFELPGSAGGTPITDLAPLVDGAAHQMVVFLRCDLGEMTSALLPFYEGLFAGLSEDQQAAFRDYMRRSVEINRMAGEAMLIGFSYGKDSFGMVGATRPPDCARYTAAYKALLQEGTLPDMGFQITVEEGVEVEGVEMDRYAVQIDWEKLMGLAGQDLPEMQAEMFKKVFGDNRIRFGMGTVGKHIVMAGGTNVDGLPGAVRTAQAASGALPARAMAAVEEAGGDPFLLAYMDMQGLVQGAMGLLKGALPGGRELVIPDGPPIPLCLWGTAEGRHYTYGLHFDMGGFVRMMKAVAD